MSWLLLIGWGGYALFWLLLGASHRCDEEVRGGVVYAQEPMTWWFALLAAALLILLAASALVSHALAALGEPAGKTAYYFDDYGPPLPLDLALLASFAAATPPAAYFAGYRLADLLLLQAAPRARPAGRRAAAVRVVRRRPR